jgi:predicted metalloprotease with PDZ domain
MASSASVKRSTKMVDFLRYFLTPLVLVFTTYAGTAFAAPAPPISLYVDTTDIARGLFHSELAIPVRPGPLTLVYPKWIPGYHAPVGPLNNIVRLKMSDNGRPIEWKRDPVDMFAFHLVVPAGVSVLHVDMDVVAPRRPNADLGASTARLFVLEWNEVVLYPQGTATDEVFTRAQIRLPAEWKFGCSMSPVRSENGLTQFPPVSLTTLVDSPLLSGKYFRTLELSSRSTPPVFIDIAADVPEALDVSSEWEARLRRLITEARALFGGFHFEQYHFLLALSDEVGNDGIEHHQSSDNRVGARLFSDEALRLTYGYLLPHEFAHSWNGKYRRPLGDAQRDFQEPQAGDLLWVYEGLTRYLNWVLAARSGLFTPQEARDYVALLAAEMDHRSGREWRSLQDTAVSAQLLYAAPDQWQSLRRSVDYYDESLFIWLEADTMIRRKTRGQRSLDDFCRAFFGLRNVPPAVDTYVLEDVTTSLNSIARYDWKTFFVTRLNATGTDRVPLEGLTASGWTLAYGDAAGSVQAARDEVHHTVEERFSLGFLTHEDGTIVDVVRDSPAWTAGLGPGMKLLTVDQRQWSPRVLHDAIAADRNSSVPMRLSVQNGSVTFAAAIDDHTGASYPRLEQNANPDLMFEILRPRTTVSATP